MPHADFFLEAFYSFYLTAHASNCLAGPARVFLPCCTGWSCFFLLPFSFFNVLPHRNLFQACHTRMIIIAGAVADSNCAAQANFVFLLLLFFVIECFGHATCITICFTTQLPHRCLPLPCRFLFLFFYRIFISFLSGEALLSVCWRADCCFFISFVRLKNKSKEKVILAEYGEDSLDLGMMSASMWIEPVPVLHFNNKYICFCSIIFFMI